MNLKENKMSDKLYTIELIDAAGPKTLSLNLLDTVNKLNNEKRNKKMVFIDGSPALDDVITEESLKKYKSSILVVNELVGG
jgi:hypothetical protein